MDCWSRLCFKLSLYKTQQCRGGGGGGGGGCPVGVTTNSRTKLSTEKRCWWLLSSEPWKPVRLDPQWLVFGLEDVSLVEFMYLVFTHMPGKSYGKQFRSLLLYSCDIFQVLTKSLHFLILDHRLSWIGESSTFLFSLADSMTIESKLKSHVYVEPSCVKGNVIELSNWLLL